MVILNTCHIREKATEKVFSELGRLQPLKARKAQGGGRMIVAVAGCVAQAEGARDPGARARCRHRARAADLSPPAGDGGARRARRRRRARHRISGRSRNSTTCRDAPAPPGVSAFLTVQEGCDKFCTFCVVPYTRGAGILAPGRGRARRGATPGRRTARARSRCSARTSTPITAPAPDGGDWGLGRLIRALAEIPGLRAHPLHHLASARHGRRADRRASRGAAADAVPASAGAVGLGPRAGGDEPPPHAPTITAASSTGCARRGPTSPCPRISSSAFPARATPISRRRSRWCARSASPRPSRSNTARGPARRPRPCRPGAGGGQGRSGCRACRRCSASSSAPSTRPASAGRCRCCSRSRGRHAGQLVGRSP